MGEVGVFASRFEEVLNIYKSRLSAQANAKLALIVA